MLNQGPSTKEPTTTLCCCIGLLVKLLNFGTMTKWLYRIYYIGTHKRKKNSQQPPNKIKYKATNNMKNNNPLKQRGKERRGDFLYPAAWVCKFRDWKEVRFLACAMVATIYRELLFSDSFLFFRRFPRSVLFLSQFVLTGEIISFPNIFAY